MVGELYIEWYFFILVMVMLSGRDTISNRLSPENKSIAYRPSLLLYKFVLYEVSLPGSYTMDR